MRNLRLTVAPFASVLLAYAAPSAIRQGSMSDGPTIAIDELASVSRAWEQLPFELRSGRVQCDFVSSVNLTTAPTHTTEGRLLFEFTPKHWRAETKRWVFAEDAKDPLLVSSIEVSTPTGNYTLLPSGLWEPIGSTEIAPTVDPRRYGRNLGSRDATITAFFSRLGYRRVRRVKETPTQWDLEMLPMAGAPEERTAGRFLLQVDPLRAFAWTRCTGYYADGRTFQDHWVRKIDATTHPVWVPKEGGLEYTSAKGVLLSRLVFSATWDRVNDFDAPDDRWLRKECSIDSSWRPRWSFGMDLANPSPDAPSPESGPPVDFQTRDSAAWWTPAIAAAVAAVVASIAFVLLRLRPFARKRSVKWS